MLNPHYLEHLYHRLGCPAWFWPLVFAVLLVLILVGSSVATDPVQTYTPQPQAKPANLRGAPRDVRKAAEKEFEATQQMEPTK